MNALKQYPPPEECLGSDPCVDSDHPEIVKLAASVTDRQATPLDNARALYYWVRDEIRYNAYALDISIRGLRASTTVALGEGWCVPKAILLSALCRAVGIPARLGYADVRNHLSTARMRETMQTDVFYYHGYSSIFLEGKWVKATPAFNIELCDKFGLRPLEFNGREDSIYHEFDVAGHRHMEYLADRGEFAEVPLDNIIDVFREHYPNLFTERAGVLKSVTKSTRWDSDVARESKAD